MKTRYIIAIAASLASCIACQKNDIGTVYAVGDSIVRFAPSVSGGTFTAGDFVTVQAPTGTPVRDEYTFIRYNTNANGGGDVYYPGDKFRILDDVTLYAEYGATLKKGDEFNSAIGSPTTLVFDYYNVWSSTVGQWSGGTDIGAGSDASHIKKFTVGTTVYILSDCVISLNEDCHDMLSGKSSITEIVFGNGVIDTHKVTNFQYTFNACSGLTTLDLSDFDTKSVNNFAHMFNDCSNLVTIKVSDKWECDKRIPDTSGEHSDVFGGCSNLVGGNGTKFNDSHKGASYAHVDGNGGNPGYLTLDR